MGNSCLTSWPLNLCLSSSRKSVQLEDEYNLSKNICESVIIPAKEPQTATVSELRILKTTVFSFLLIRLSSCMALAMSGIRVHLIRLIKCLFS